MRDPIDRAADKAAGIYARLRRKDVVAPVSESGAIMAAAILMAATDIVAALDEIRVELRRR
ncbi:MAG: hypothetical protein R3330_17480 [Saprospiraceae bacterium]|nr:hypothetical protein [Saprospiraceae bacterium]